MASRVQQKSERGRSRYGAAAKPEPSLRYDDPEAALEDIPALEWITGALGFVLVAGVIIFLCYSAITVTHSPPDITVSVASVMPRRNGYLVIVKAVNYGGSTAAGVVVEGEIRNASQVLERSETTLDYSPPGSEKHAGLFFTRDPRQFKLQVRALGYVEP
jgi:uncharacterized protein (TIGR02588 family)